MEIQNSDDFLCNVYRHTANNRAEVEVSSSCHCICCQTDFLPSEIDGYADGGRTVLCPNCDCDAVIGDACGFELSAELLEQLHNRYFNYDDIE